MRHYLWHRPDGSLGGHMTFWRGFPETCDPSDPDTTDPTAIGLRAQYTGRPDFGGIVPYDCPCPVDVNVCSCPSDRMWDTRIVGGAVAALPVVGWVVDGVPVEPNAGPVVKTPGADVVVSLAVLSGDVPDGTVVMVRSNGQPLLAPAFPIPLTIVGGVSGDVTFRAPGQGFTGSVVIAHGVYCATAVLRVTGW